MANEIRWTCALLMALALLSLLTLSESQAQAPTAFPRIETGGHGARIARIDSDSSGRWLVTASSDKTARVWDLSTGRLERVLRPPIGEGDEGELYAVAISPDGSHVAVGGFTGSRVGGVYPIYLFDRASARLIARSRAFGTVTNKLVFTRDGKRLAAAFAAGEGVRVLNAGDLSEALKIDDCKELVGGIDLDAADRLVSSCDDGFIRLYNAAGKRVAERKFEGNPWDVRFSPDASHIAVGFLENSRIAVLSGRNLALLYRPDSGLVNRRDNNLGSVAWSQDGERLYAGGGFSPGSVSSVLVWRNRGRGMATRLAAAPITIMDLKPLAGGRIAFATAGAAWGVLDAQGRHERLLLRPTLDHRGNQEKFRLSANGERVEFGFDRWDGTQWSQSLARFDITTRTLETNVVPQPFLALPRTEGLAVTDWRTGTPKLAGRPLVLRSGEDARSLSIDSNARSFVLGNDWTLRRFDDQGRQLWSTDIPGEAWTVNQSADGRFVVAALDDGTIRWYETATGRQRLALFIDARDKRWVLFTPEGFYQASAGGDALLGYQINRGPDREGQFVDSNQLATAFFRPDLITHLLAGDEAALTTAMQSIGDVRTVLANGLPPTLVLLSEPRSESSTGEYSFVSV